MNIRIVKENYVRVKATVRSEQQLFNVQLAILCSLEDKPKATMSVTIDDPYVLQLDRRIRLFDGQNYLQLIA